MNWIEMIHLRSYSQQDRDAALDAFGGLLLPDEERGLERISLFRNLRLDNDLSIFILWRDTAALVNRSPLGLQLAAAFSEFGQIYHSAWTHDSSIVPGLRGPMGEKQASG